MRALGVKDANFNPKTSQYIEEIIRFIDDLINRGHAYVVEGEVFFDIKSFPNYGELSNRNVDDMLVGVRIGDDTRKKNPADFTLWKPTKEGEPFWTSPWSEGRPAWHIECSVMASSLLGNTFDIHAGGNDLIFPHHENEKAQSEAHSGKPYAKYWMHNGMLQMGGKKMSKSVGNIISVREAVQKYGTDAIRLFFLSAHFRGPVDYSEERFAEWQKSARKVQNFLQKVEDLFDGQVPEVKHTSDWIEDKRGKFIEYLDDDFNSSRVVGMIFDIIKELKFEINQFEINQFEINQFEMDKLEADKIRLTEAYYLIRGEFYDVLGLFASDKKDVETPVEDKFDYAMSVLVDIRKRLRSERNFILSDQIRDQLSSVGISLLDGKDGTSWEIKK